MLTACSGGGDQQVESASESDTTRGETIYRAKCANCHPSLAPPLEDIAWDAGRIRRQVREGSNSGSGAGRMPPMSEAQLSVDNLEALLAYLKTLGAVR